MSLKHIRDAYNVPAFRGVRVKARGHLGVITGGREERLRVRLDGLKCSLNYHPYGVEYLACAETDMKIKRGRLNVGGLEYIRKAYGVPAWRGWRVKVGEHYGVITRAQGMRLRVRLDGEKKVRIYHPSWQIEYLPADEQERKA